MTHAPVLLRTSAAAASTIAGVDSSAIRAMTRRRFAAFIDQARSVFAQVDQEDTLGLRDKKDLMRTLAIRVAIVPTRWVLRLNGNGLYGFLAPLLCVVCR